MDPKTLAAIVSSLGLATFVSWLLHVAAAQVAARSPDRPVLRRIAGSSAWPAVANTVSIAWLTAMGIEIALVGVTERTIFILTIWFILALRSSSAG